MSPSIMCFFLVLIFSLVSVAFYTLMERRVLGNFHLRLGPFMTGFMGYFQPFSDAKKLFLKDNMMLRFNLFLVWFFSASFSLMLYMMMLLVFPLGGSSLFFSSIFLIFICLISMSVYFLMLGGFYSGSKYSILGSYRSVIQMISYEIVLMFLFVLLFFFFDSWNFSFFFFVFSSLNFFFCLPFFFIWLLVVLAESNRLPYDFLEGESELVSGFNTEYWGGYFSFLFIYEYGCMILFSIFSSYFFFSKYYSLLFFMVLLFLFFWIRASFPRFRFDFLMKLVYKNLLLISMSIFFFFFFF